MEMTEKEEMAKLEDALLPVKSTVFPALPEKSAFGYYTVKELANIIGFHPDTVYEWIYKKSLPVRQSGFKGRITVYWPEFIKWWSCEGGRP